MWVTILSDHLPVIALVGRYPANKLMGREPIPERRTFGTEPMQVQSTSGINPRFRGLFRTRGQVTHVLLTLSPLSVLQAGLHVRLACLIHAASVHSEPGSNSPLRKTHDPITGSEEP